MPTSSEQNWNSTSKSPPISCRTLIQKQETKQNKHRSATDFLYKTNLKVKSQYSIYKLILIYLNSARLSDHLTGAARKKKKLFGYVFQTNKKNLLSVIN